MSEERVYKIIAWRDPDCPAPVRFEACFLWTLDEVLEEINRDHSEDWTDYDETDWREGWNEWVVGDGYYTMVNNKQAFELV